MVVAPVHDDVPLVALEVGRLAAAELPPFELVLTDAVERIAGSAFFRDPDAALRPQWQRLDELGIPSATA